MAAHKIEGLTATETQVEVKKMVHEKNWGRSAALNLFQLLQRAAEKEAKGAENPAVAEVEFQDRVVKEMMAFAQEEHDAVINGKQPVYKAVSE